MIGSTISAQTFVQKSEQRLKEIYPNLMNLEYKSFHIDQKTKQQLENKFRQAFYRKEL